MRGEWWLYVPDMERESWCLLVSEVDYNEMRINEWMIGYGNRDKIVRTVRGKWDKEEQELKKLFKEIYYCKEKGIILIMFDDGILKILRTKTLLSDLNGAFQGLFYVSIKELLRKFFLDVEVLLGTTAADIVSFLPTSARFPQKRLEKELKALWELFLRIGPLVPRKFIRRRK